MLLPPPVRRRAAGPLHMNVLTLDDPRIRRLGFLGQAKFRRKLPPFVPVRDEELSAITAPTLVLLGEKSQIHKTMPLRIRLQRCAPASLVVETVPDAGHSLPMDHAPEVAARARSFLARVT
jgi:pimeloyl-ACP methyl ester carboxylesterase